MADVNFTTYGDQWKGINSEDGQDGLYNKDKESNNLKAKAGPKACGVLIPIHIDVLAYLQLCFT